MALPLTRCAGCGSSLVQAGPFVPRSGTVTVRRLCPECGRCDWVNVDADRAAAWSDREAQIRAELEATADELQRADAVILEP
jgi:hypothetical protein